MLQGFVLTIHTVPNAISTIKKHCIGDLITPLLILDIICGH